MTEQKSVQLFLTRVLHTSSEFHSLAQRWEGARTCEERTQITNALSVCKYACHACVGVEGFAARACLCNKVTEKAIN